MSEDLLDLNIEAVYTESVFNRTLILIEDKCIEICNMALKDLSMPSPVRTTQSEAVKPLLLDRDTVLLQKAALNDDQRKAYSSIMEKIDNNSGGIFFLDAPGGTGKTFLTNLIISEVIINGGDAMAVASSGILHFNFMHILSISNYNFCSYIRYCSDSSDRRSNGAFRV